MKKALEDFNKPIRHPMVPRCGQYKLMLHRVERFTEVEQQQVALGVTFHACVEFINHFPKPLDTGAACNTTLLTGVKAVL
jgi:hypothetical protein